MLGTSKLTSIYNVLQDFTACYKWKRLHYIFGGSNLSAFQMEYDTKAFCSKNK